MILTSTEKQRFECECRVVEFSLHVNVYMKSLFICCYIEILLNCSKTGWIGEPQTI